MSVARLCLVWVALLGLLALTIGASFLPLGPVLPFVSYAIAAAKAGLVLWFFMELKQDRGLGRIAVAAGFLWLTFLLTLVAADVLSRGWFGT
jgi:cytochrome c oxidase subunit 4